MSNDDLTECLACGAMVDRMSKHRAWHRKIDDQFRDLEAMIRRVGRD